MLRVCRSNALKSRALDAKVPERPSSVQGNGNVLNQSRAAWNVSQLAT
jgi:hypothetical protein